MTKSAEPTSTCLATALHYAKHGLLVVPLHGLRDGRCTCGRKNCKQPGRHPRIEDATSKPAEIEAFGSWSSSRIASRPQAGRGQRPARLRTRPLLTRKQTPSVGAVALVDAGLPRREASAMTPGS